MPSLEEKWEAQFDLLENFLTAHGRLPRQFCDDPAEESLGSWMKGQRRSAKAGRLTVGRIHRLRALPVPGVLDKVPPPDRIGDLAAFVSENGRLPKSTAPEGSEERDLGQFMIHYLRPKLKAGLLSKESASRVARIPGVTRFAYQPDQDERLEQVRAFIADAGHVPRYSTAPGVPAGEALLARWIRNTLGRPQADGDEAAGRVARLREILADTVPYPVYRATSILDFTETYLAEHGTLPAASALGSPERRAYAWLQNRRNKGDADAYGPQVAARIRAMLEHSFPREAGWEARLAELNAYIAEHGKLPTGFHDGPLYRWLASQRAAGRQGALTADREQVLRSIPGILPKRAPGRPKKRKASS